MECAIPRCTREKYAGLTDMVCSYHARRIFTEVREMLEAATEEHRREALRHGRGTARPRRDLQNGYVYFFKCGELVKIGWSANVRQRARDLSADRVIGYFPGTPQDEKAIHARFGYCWDHGEYFAADPELVAFAESHAR